MRASSVAFLMIIVAVISAGVTYVLTSEDVTQPAVNGAAVVSSNPTASALLTQVADGSLGLERFVTVEIPITTTPDPNVIMVTVTPPGETDAGIIEVDDGGGAGATESVDAEVTADAQVAAVPLDAQGGDRPDTIDPELFNRAGRYTGTQEQLPAGCLLHTISDGEFPTLIIINYDLPAQTTFIMMAMNGLSEETATNLQIGETLVVPFEGCPIDDFLEIQGTIVPGINDGTNVVEGDNGDITEETPEPDETAEAEPSVEPTVTLAPTASGSTVEIVDVTGAGELEVEGVEVVNNGNTVDIGGWTLNDGDGNIYTFPDQRRLFSGASVTVNTRAGENTAILFFWGQDEAVFGEPGDVVVLTDTDGRVQSSLRLP